MLSLGTYPDVSLKDARARRDTARKLLAEGIDPGEQRKEAKAERAMRAANSLEAVTREWAGKMAETWVPAYGERLLRRFERDVFPQIGKKPIGEIKPMELLATLRKIEARGAIETAHRARGDCGQVFRYAIATGRAERDIAADLRGALTPKQTKHFASVTEPAKVAELLRALDGYQGSFIVFGAMRLAPLLFVRPGELRHAEWKDIDLDAAEWRYTVTKTKTAHIVPLATQAVAIPVSYTHLDVYKRQPERVPTRASGSSEKRWITRSACISKDHALSDSSSPCNWCIRSSNAS